MVYLFLLNMVVKAKPMGKISDADIDRLICHLDIPWHDMETKCWECNLTQSDGSYCRIQLNGRLVMAHRMMCVYNNHGYDPLHLDACHSCDNSKCSSPFHLSFGTQSQNEIDKVMRTTNHNFQKLTPEQVKEIKKLLLDGNLLQRQIGERYGVSEVEISLINTGKRWAHLKI